MDLITSSDVGAVSLDRMVREGVLEPLSPGFAAPLDLPITPIDRAASLAPLVPAHTVVSGLSGLWVHVGGPRPHTLDLVGLRGLHRFSPGFQPEGWVVRFHSGAAALEPAWTVGGVRIAGCARSAADSLRWGALAAAIPAVLVAIRHGTVGRDAVSRLVAGESPRGLGVARMRSAWRAVEAALR